MGLFASSLEQQNRAETAGCENSASCGTELCCLHRVLCMGLFASSLEQQTVIHTDPLVVQRSGWNSLSCGTELENSAANSAGYSVQGLFASSLELQTVLR
jgi:hypothetical protein